MISRAAKTNLSTRARFLNLPSRYWLLGSGIAGFIVALIVISQALFTYDLAYQFFQKVALESKAKIQDSDAALQSIAQVSTDVVNFVVTAGTVPNADAAKAIYDNFDKFRRDMFKVTTNLEGGAETDAFYAAERAVYDEFWPHITAMLTAKARGDAATTVQEYSAADEILQNKVIPNLTKVEEYNFAAMQRTERNAAAAILSQLVILGILTVGLALMITALSVWLRAKVRRYLTPGLDAATILAWLLAITMFADFAQTPGQLKSLVEDSYYSVSATQRIVAIATQANRTESAMILDSRNAQKWQQLFDQNDTLIQQALCGYQGCVNTQFNTKRRDTIDPEVVAEANRRVPRTGLEVLKVVPLVANVTYLGEPEAIENARKTYIHYLSIDRRIRDLIGQDQIQGAIILDTSDSDAAFKQFIAAVEAEKKINTDWFDTVWQAVQNVLPSHRLLLGLGGYVLVIALLGLGVYHRYREL